MVSMRPGVEQIENVALSRRFRAKIIIKRGNKNGAGWSGAGRGEAGWSGAKRGGPWRGGMGRGGAGQGVFVSYHILGLCVKKGGLLLCTNSIEYAYDMRIF